MSSRYLIRVWLPDRPGSLGGIASAIGEAGGDVEGVEILEAGAGRAVDELLIGTDDIDAVLVALTAVEGVDVEWVKPAEVGDGGPDLEALEGVSSMTAATAVGELVGLARRTTSSEWAAVVRLDAQEIVVAEGSPPAAAWLAAFVAGIRHAEHDGEGVDELCWADLGADTVLVLGREGHPFRRRERRRVTALAAAVRSFSHGRVLD